MYDMIDQPVRSLNRGGRLLVGAMRHWVKAAGMGRCPCGDIGAAFQAHGLMPCLPHFNMMMAVLNREALTPLRFGAVSCGQVSEHEALLIGLLRTISRMQPQAAKDTMAMIVVPEAAGTLLIALTAMGQGLAYAGLTPAHALHDPECNRFPHE